MKRNLSLVILLVTFCVSACGNLEVDIEKTATPPWVIATQLADTELADTQPPATQQTGTPAGKVKPSQTPTSEPVSATPGIPTPDVMGNLAPCQMGGLEVYLVIASQRRHIEDMATFLALGYTSDQIVDCGVAATLPEGQPLTRLLKGSGDPVYWLQDGRRRHIPNMEAFTALGFQVDQIAAVPDAVLAHWPEGAPLPAVLPTLTPTRPAPTAPASATLRDALVAIHSQFQIDPARGCFELLSPYADYQRGLQQMTVLLLTDPRAQALSLAERQALFANVTGFDGVRFFPSDRGVTLVKLTGNRGHTRDCTIHSTPADTLYVVTERGGINDVATEGLVAQIWALDNPGLGGLWAVLVKLKMDSTSGPTPWQVWRIGRNGGGQYERQATLVFSPVPYDFDPPPTLQFASGGQTLTADLSYWWADDPCAFSTAFTDSYKHDTWRIRRTYTLGDGGYALTASQVLTFTVLHKDTGVPAPDVDWTQFCTGPIQ